MTTQKLTRAQKKAAKLEAEAALLTQNLETALVTETEAEIEAAIAEFNPGDGLIGMTEAESAAFEEPADTEAPIEPTTTADFDQAMLNVSAEDTDAKLAAAIAAIKERQSFELVKDPTNEKIQKTLNSVHKAICSKRAARLMVVCNVDPAILNRTMHEGVRYNVYAMGKLADTIFGLTNDDAGQAGKVGNAINLACMKSLFRFRAAGVPYTGEMAKCSASDKIKVDRAVNEMLVRHTVASSTAPTQASSTMQALETLGVVTRTGSQKNPTFVLTNNPVVAKLESRLAA